MTIDTVGILAQAVRDADVARAQTRVNYRGVVLVGPPGAGKLLAVRGLYREYVERSPLASREREQLAFLYLFRQEGWNGVRPFRAPHHTISELLLLGGSLPSRTAPGGRRAFPGEVSLAHLGVLFLDGLPEFRRSTVERLGRALRDGYVGVRSRIQESPARFPAVPAYVFASINISPRDPADYNKRTLSRGREFASALGLWEQLL